MDTPAIWHRVSVGQESRRKSVVVAQEQDEVLMDQTTASTEIERSREHDAPNAEELKACDAAWRNGFVSREQQVLSSLAGRIRRCRLNRPVLRRETHTEEAPQSC
jgi:hypothetical protein